MRSMAKPLVSVVIPAFKSERFLAEAIESVLAQTYDEVETIVVDDGSPDRSAEIAAGYAEVKLVRQENRGVAAARNAGVAVGSGEVLAFLDADDLMLPERLETQVGHLLAHPEVGCVVASQETFVEDGAPLPFWARGNEQPLFEKLDRAEGIDKADTSEIFTTSMIFSRALFEEIGGFDEELLLGNDDADILMRLSEAGIEIARLRDVVIRRRIHADNVTQDEEQAKTAIFEVFKRRIDRHRARRA
jgi:glycosyltransferase involved in cell wall biosynthesis